MNNIVFKNLSPNAQNQLKEMIGDTTDKTTFIDIGNKLSIKANTTMLPRTALGNFPSDAIHVATIRGKTEFHIFVTADEQSYIVVE
jgi:hypothetical protein